MPSFGEISRQELMSLSPLQLAYIGDSVYDLLVRGHLLRENRKLLSMHKSAVARVSAVAQAKTLEALLPHLEEDELEYVRRGRNAHARHSAPKSASTADYAASTGLETLLGYLYVQGREERLKELFRLTLSDQDQ